MVHHVVTKTIGNTPVVIGFLIKITFSLQCNSQCNSMNVIIGLCHSFNRKVCTFQESLMLVTQAFVDLQRLLKGTYFSIKTMTK